MIFSNTQLTEFDTLYSQYNDTIKPLLIQVETRYESLPTPIHNELRKASGHIKRTIFDCFKFLNVALSDVHKKFEKRTEKIDLTAISNGTFYIKYRELVVDAQNAVREAKKLESQTKNHDAAFTEYEKAFQLYSELETLINENVCNVNWARGKSAFTTIGVIIYSIVIFLIGTIVSIIIEDLIEDKCVGKSTLVCIIDYLFNK